MAANETTQERRGRLFIDQLDPICAPATAIGGAIAIVRISGKGSISIADHIFHPTGGKSLDESPAQSVRFGHLKTDKDNILDECLATIFRAPHSYTGEDSVELSLHGSPYIVSETLRLLCSNGCRMAEPGEFTKRAFLAGKLDLSQAEAVADLISASSQASHRVAINQLRGHFSSELSLLRDELLRLSALLELELDFDDHETTEFADRTELLTLAIKTDQRVTELARSYDTGQALKQGIPVAIVGKTNVGKSTLLNRLLRDDRAIVSNTHGTTRDTIEDTIQLHGTLFRFIDTAGLRHTDDTVERIGIERTYEAIARAQIVVYVFDKEPAPKELAEMQKRIQGKATIYVRNKTDLQPTTVYQNVLNVSNATAFLSISAKSDKDLSPLEEAIYTAAGLETLNESGTIVTSARHRDALLRAHDALFRVTSGLQNGTSGDLLAEDLRLAIAHLAEITGHSLTPEATLHHIFEHFCVGK